jgi:octopine/nopaline transport system permease protein
VLELLQFGAAGWGDELARGAAMTLLVALCGFALGNVVGVAGALAQASRLRPLVIVVAVYTTIVRGVPELLVIYLLFFGGGELLLRIGEALGIGGDVGADALLAGTISIGVIAGAYSTEVFRGALAAIPRGQIEAAHAFGMSRAAAFRLIRLPQLLRFALPGMGNVWQNVLKDTALISVMSLAELMRVTHLGAGSTHRPFLFYGIAIALYLAMTALSNGLFDRAEARFNRGVRSVAAR